MKKIKFTQLHKHCSAIALIMLEECKVYTMDVNRAKNEGDIEYINIKFPENECFGWLVLEPLSKYCIEKNLEWTIKTEKDRVSLKAYLVLEINLPSGNE